jgi:hypothetical protein
MDPVSILTQGYLGYMSLMWAVVTTLWLGFVGYRAVMSNHEEDQLFLGKGEEHMAADQQAAVGKLVRLGKPIWALGILSGMLLLTILGVWFWQGLRTNF